MTEAVSVAISVLALATSVVTAWLTLAHRGTVKMTRPTQIFFGADRSRWENALESPKIYMRSLMFATSKRGRVVESMHIRLIHNQVQQVFDIWVYGEGEKLVRGGGLFVGETGVAANHHFLLPPNGETFAFTMGMYRIDVLAHVFGDEQRRLLFSDELEVTSEAISEMNTSGAGLYFDWAPDAARYISHVERNPRQPVPWSLETFAQRDQ